MQRCTNCGEISDHGPNKARKNGLQSWCRTCLNETKLQRYYEWRDALLQQRGPCIDCGSWKRLEFDHVDPDEKEGNVSKLWSTPQWREELVKCDVRCHDCHVKRSSREGHFDSHKNRRKVTPQDDTIIQAPTATLFYGRKVGLPNYSNEEFSTFLQVPLDGITDNKQLEALLDEQAAMLKAWVMKQLSVPYTIDPQTGVVVGEAPIAEAKPAKKSYSARGATSAPKAAPSKGGPVDKDHLWALLATATKHGDNFKASTGETIWWNVANKRNPNSPDAKFADSNEGLWLDRAPAWFTGPGEGVAE